MELSNSESLAYKEGRSAASQIDNFLSIKDAVTTANFYLGKYDYKIFFDASEFLRGFMEVAKTKLINN